MGKKTKGFKKPKPMKITDRTSSITNASVNGIIPSITPTQEEIDKALGTLGMTSKDVKCAYCGGKATEWDHFFPLIDDKGPTGYITEIHNLVPCCSTCNSSKGNQRWRDWFYGDAENSPKTRNVEDLDERYNRLDKYEKTYTRTILDIKKIIGEEDWNKYQQSIKDIIDKMKDAQVFSDEIKKKLKKYYDAQNGQ